MSMNIKKLISTAFMQIILLFTVVISIFPILWIIMSSFKTNEQIINNPFTLPTTFNFDAYLYIFEKYDFLRYTLNSVLVSCLPTLLALLFYTMSAYVIAKYSFPGKNLFYSLFIITMLVPVHSRTQPIFTLIMKLNLYNTITGVGLVYLSLGMAMSMFILKATFQALPSELNEAATLDGASFTKTFWLINIPLAKSGLATAGVLMFLANWNEFYYANLLVSSQSNKTLPIITILFTSMFNYNYTNTFAALAVVVIPGILFYALLQKQVQQSIISSSVKG